MAGEMNLGPYELRGELGRGAMAKVWRAWDPKLEREVAIKEPLFDERLAEDVITELSARFIKEGKAAARLNHPGIVTIYAADVYDNRPVIVMEIIDGITLGEMLQAGALLPQVTLDALGQLLDAVGYAHSQGVVHRDIKPDNIFVTKDGRVKLSDFGIARIEDSSQTKATQIGTILGTPGYMAPEQATGSPVDNRTDLFAIGTIAYEMLTGKNPFGAGDGIDSTVMLYRIVHEPAPNLPDVASEGLPADIRPAILASLNKNPLERPQDAASFKAMLHGAPAPVASTLPAPSPTLLQKPAQSKKWLPYALVGGVGAVVIALVLMFSNPSGGSGVGLVTTDSTPAPVSLSTDEQPEEQANNQTDNTASDAIAEEKESFILTVAGGRVALYREDEKGTRNLEYITSIEVSGLKPETASLLSEGEVVPDLKTAEAVIELYQAEFDSNQVVYERSFVVVPGLRTWDEARAYCEGQGGRLACIHNQDDYNKVLRVAQDAGYKVYWIGAYLDGGSFYWVDGRPMTFTAWAAGEPNNDGGIENRAALFYARDMWAWYDTPNDLSATYSSSTVALIMEKELPVQ
ncbi:MAG: protein kinase [Coriobacteriia bacterium]|nr:protein kinase [Coriobacteriia bacterium]